MNKHASAGGAFLLSSLKQYGCEGEVGKAVEAAFASNCAQSETRASLCFAILEAFLNDTVQGGAEEAPNSSFVGKDDLLLLCRWKLSVDMPFSISTLRVLCDKLARTLVLRFSRSGVTCVTTIYFHVYVCVNSCAYAHGHIWINQDAKCFLNRCVCVCVCVCVCQTQI